MNLQNRSKANITYQFDQNKTQILLCFQCIFSPVFQNSQYIEVILQIYLQQQPHLNHLSHQLMNNTNARNTYSHKPQNINPFDHYSGMLKQASWAIRSMLDNLMNIYKRYRVRFSVAQYYDCIYRLVIPVELKGVLDSNQIGFIIQNRSDANQLLNFEGRNAASSYKTIEHLKQTLNRHIKQKNLDQRSNDQIVYTSQISKNNQNSRKIDPLKFQDRKQDYFNQGREDNLYNQNSTIENPQIYGPTKIQGDINRSNHINRKPGVRSRGLQGKLCSWIVDEHRRGQLITRQDVINKAKQIGKDSNLKGSVGWYSNFIRRNPHIRQILAKGNLARPTSKRNTDFPQQSNRYQSYKHYPSSMKQKISRSSLDTQQYEYMRMRGGIYDEQDLDAEAQRNQKLHKQEESEYSDLQDLDESPYGDDLGSEQQLQENQGLNNKQSQKKAQKNNAQNNDRQV